MLFVPGVAVAAAEVEEFEGALGAVAGGDVAVSFVSFIYLRMTRV